MYDKPLTIEQMLAMLAAAPARLAGLTAGRPAVRLQTPPAPGEWSAREALAHLRACSDICGKYIRVILSQDRPRIKAVTPTRRIKQTDYLEQEFQPSLQAFTVQRLELLDVLRLLASEDWSRMTTVTSGGKLKKCGICSRFDSEPV